MIINEFYYSYIVLKIIGYKVETQSLIYSLLSHPFMFYALLVDKIIFV